MDVTSGIAAFNDTNNSSFNNNGPATTALRGLPPLSSQEPQSAVFPFEIGSSGSAYSVTSCPANLGAVMNHNIQWQSRDGRSSMLSDSSISQKKNDSWRNLRNQPRGGKSLFGNVNNNNGVLLGQPNAAPGPSSMANWEAEGLSPSIFRRPMLHVHESLVEQATDISNELLTMDLSRNSQIGADDNTIDAVFRGSHGSDAMDVVVEQHHSSSSLSFAVAQAVGNLQQHDNAERLKKDIDEFLFSLKQQQQQQQQQPSNNDNGSMGF
jgi:hypothetical protein